MILALEMQGFVRTFLTSLCPVLITAADTLWKCHRWWLREHVLVIVCGGSFACMWETLPETRWDEGRLKHVGGGVDKWKEAGRQEKHPGGCGGLAARKGGRAAQVSCWNNCMDRVPFAEVNSQRGASWVAWVEILHPVWAWWPQTSAQCHIWLLTGCIVDGQLLSPILSPGSHAWVCCPHKWYEVSNSLLSALQMWSLEKCGERQDEGFGPVHQLCLWKALFWLPGLPSRLKQDWQAGRGSFCASPNHPWLPVQSTAPKRHPSWL